MEGLIMGEFAWIYWAILLAVAIIIILGIKREEILEFFSRIFAKKRRKSSYELFREYCRDSFEECAIHPVCNTLSSNPRLSAIIGNYRKIQHKLTMNNNAEKWMYETILIEEFVIAAEVFCGKTYDMLKESGSREALHFLDEVEGELESDLFID